MSDVPVVPVSGASAPPDEADARYGESLARVRSGDLDGARELLLAALRDHPDSWRILYRLADTELRARRLPAALQFVEAALRVRPDLVPAHTARAQILADLGRHDEAGTAAETAIRYAPRDPATHYTAVRVAVHAGGDAAYLAALAGVDRAERAGVTGAVADAGFAAERGAALGGLDLVREARAEFAAALAGCPDSGTTRAHASALEMRAWHLARAARHMGHRLSGPATDPRVSRVAVRLARLCGLYLVLGAGTALAVGAGAQWLTSGSAAGAGIAAAAVGAYLALVARSAVLTGGGLRGMLRVAARDARTMLAGWTALALLGGAVLTVVSPAAMLRSPGVYATYAGVVAAVNGLVLGAEIATFAVQRYRHARRMRPYALAPAAPGPPDADMFPVDTPAPGQLVLAATVPRGSGRLPFAEYSMWGIRMAVLTSGAKALVATGMLDPGAAAAAGVELVTFPIEPTGAPAEPDVDRLIDRVAGALGDGRSTVAVCDTGAGRSALVAAAVLVRLGLDAGSAWQRVAAARGAPLGLSPAQRDWFDRYAASRRR